MIFVPLSFFCWTRKPALSNSPVDCCNRRGFSAERRVQQENNTDDRSLHIFFVYYSLILFFGICVFPIFLFRRNLKISSNCLFTNRKLSAIIFDVLNMARWCSRLARQPVTLEVDGSSPFRVAKKEATPKGWLPFWQFEKRTRKTNPTPRWGVDRRVGARRYHTIPEKESATSPFRVKLKQCLEKPPQRGGFSAILLSA